MHGFPPIHALWAHWGKGAVAVSDSTLSLWSVRADAEDDDNQAKDRTEVTPKWYVDQKDQIHPHPKSIHFLILRNQAWLFTGPFLQIPRQPLFPAHSQGSSYPVSLYARTHSPVHNYTYAYPCSLAHTHSPEHCSPMHTFAHPQTHICMMHQPLIPALLQEWRTTSLSLTPPPALTHFWPRELFFIAPAHVHLVL